MGDEAGLHTPRLNVIWNGKQGHEGGRETAGEAVSGEVVQVVLRDGLIWPSADVPIIVEVKNTAAQGTER